MPALSPDLLQAMNLHVTQELAASHSYLQAASYLHELGLDGMSRWMMVQSEEERLHARKFIDHVHARHGTVRLEQIPAPPPSTGKARDVFALALRLEEETTARIHRLHAASETAGDVALRIFLEWFVQEQVGEEDTLRTLLDRFALAGDDRGALLLLDQEFGRRVAAGKKE